MNGSEPTNPLRDYFENNPGRHMMKWTHYFDVYHRHLAKLRNQPVVVLEIGVYHGGSLQMWKQYFGPQARIIGVDRSSKCKGLAEPQIEIVIGDQEDREFLRRLASKVGQVDVVIDDGGHTMQQQIATFEEVYPAVRAGGVYMVEDTHTSYWKDYGGGYAQPGTFIEYSKHFIDKINAWHACKEGGPEVDAFTRSTTSVHFYDSVVVLEKANRTEPTAKHTGKMSW